MPGSPKLRSVEATEPLTRWLIAAARERKTLAYGDAATRLRKVEKFERVIPRNMAIVAGSAMTRILEVEREAPILVSLLVCKNTELPGEGVKEYFKSEMNCGDIWKETIEEEKYKVFSYRNWLDVYARVYGHVEEGETVSRPGREDGAGGRPAPAAFRPLVPNDETVEAIEAVRRGELVTVGSVKALMEELNADG